MKIVAKYENLITILVSQFLGREERNIKCQKEILQYVDKIEEIVKEGIKVGQIKEGNPKAIASEIYGLICSTLVYKLREDNFEVKKLFVEYDNTIIAGLRKN
ncbi:hypothetical protein D3C72_1274870 [compost metagenome]